MAHLDHLRAERENTKVIIEIDAEVNHQELDEKEYKRQLTALQERIEQDFPWNGVVHRVERNEDIETLIIVTLWNKLNREQVTWLNTNTEIANWTWDPAGFLTVPAVIPTISAYPCEFHYPTDGNQARLIVCRESGNLLQIKGKQADAVATDEVLYQLLGEGGIPLIGWTQTVWFCERCGNPGASSGYEKCPQCEQEYRAFMQAPMQDMLALTQTPLSPHEILAQAKWTLQQELLSTQMQLRESLQTPAKDRWMVEMDIGVLQDDQSRLVAQITLIGQIQSDPALQSASALEGLLRSLFHRVDEIRAALRDLPLFEDIEEDEVVNLDEAGQAAYKQVQTLQDEQYRLDRQIDLVARFLGVSAWRIGQVRCVMGAFYEDEETRSATKEEEAATYYPVVKRWIEGTGTIKALVFPDHFAAWMKDRPETASLSLVA
jgi:hypothetical protein